MGETTCDLDWAKKKCVPCEGGIPKIEADRAAKLMDSIPGWTLSADAARVKRSWVMNDFSSAIAFFQEIAEISEREDHHPDLHLERYRHVTVEIWTHAVGGLSENDFILAGKINELKPSLKS
jgi:4a-hydroxytetrahydrobiopterin dehydratase